MSKRKYKSIFDGRCRSEWMHLIDEWIHDELDRKMVVLHHLDGHSYDRVCDDIGNTLEYDQVRSRIQAATKQLISHS